MDVILLIIGLILVIIGIIGCIVPGIPGPISGWAGLLVMMLSKVIPEDWYFIFITFLVALVISVLDYFIPAIGSKKFGGSKYGIYGAVIGLLIGIIAPIPGGILIVAFVGAFIGEYIRNKHVSQAVKAAFGAFVGFLISTGMQLIVAIIFLILYIQLIKENWIAVKNLF